MGSEISWSATGIRYAERTGKGCGPFLLTSALSLREREDVRQRVREAGAPSIVQRLASVLPLPNGEGWGEGEGGVRLSAAADLSKLTCRYGRPKGAGGPFR